MSKLSFLCLCLFLLSFVLKQKKVSKPARTYRSVRAGKNSSEIERDQSSKWKIPFAISLLEEVSCGALSKSPCDVLHVSFSAVISLVLL
jgi:hypothetical protein